LITLYPLDFCETDSLLETIYMSEHLHDAFEVCLSALTTGAKLDACLALYPDLSEELRPLLVTAQRARQAGIREVPIAAVNRSRAKLIARAGELRGSPKPLFNLFSFPRLALATLAVVLVFFLSINGLVVVSAKSLPGDALYPVKLAAENVSLKLAPSTELRQKMTEDYQQRRTDEVRSLLSQSLERRIALEGVVSDVSASGLLIDSIPVILDAQTKISGNLLPGRLVKLEGVTQPGGFVKADTIQLRFYEYAGELKTTQDGAWTIGDTSFKILDGTRIDPALKIGDQVLVLVYSGDDGTLYAQAILRVPETLSGSSQSEHFEIEFTGTIEAISGETLTVGGKTVHVNADTEITGDIAIGAQVKVHALVAEDGTITATEIKPAEDGASQVGDDQEHSEDSSGSGDDQGVESSDDGEKSNSDSLDDDPSGDDRSDDEDKSGYGSGEDDQSYDDGKSDDDKSKDDSSQSDDSSSSSDSDHSDESEEKDSESAIFNPIAFFSPVM
jgi:hypothetical protein